MDSNKATIGTFWLTFAILILTAAMLVIMVWPLLQTQRPNAEPSTAQQSAVGTQGGVAMNGMRPILSVGVILAIAVAMQIYLAFKLRKNKELRNQITTLTAELAKRSIVARQKMPSESASNDTPLRFAITGKNDGIRVTVNRHHFWISLAFLDSGAFDKNWQVKGFPVRVYTEPNGYEPLVDTKVYSKEAGLVEIRRSRLLVIPAGWDENRNSRAIEVVNEYGIPVFQTVLSAANQLDIDAVFSEALSKSGWRLEALFKYPSKEHPGEFVRDFGLFPLNAKSLYQLFLGGCGQSAVSHGGYRMTSPEAKEFLVEYAMCHDTNSKALYFNIFMSKGGDPAHLLKLFAAEYQDFLKPHLRGNAFIRMNPGEPPERATGLVFTGVIGIYHEESFLPEEAEAIRQEFLNHGGASVRFYGPDYVIIRNSPLIDRASGRGYSL